MGWSCLMETPHLHDYCTQCQYDSKATPTHMVSHGKLIVLAPLTDLPCRQWAFHKPLEATC